MRNNLINKGLVFGIIVLFIGTIISSVAYANVSKVEQSDELNTLSLKGEREVVNYNSKQSTPFANHQIIPKPQLIKDKEYNLTLNDNWVICTNITDSRYNFSAKCLMNNLSESNSIILNILDLNNIPNNNRIILGSCHHPYIKALLRQRKINYPTYLGNESYILQVFSDCIEEIIIVGLQPNGVFYGVQTLLQLINENNVVEGVSIIDYPDYKVRGVHSNNDLILKGWPLKMTPEQKIAIDELAKLKINTILDPDWDYFYHDTKKWLEGWLEFINYTSKRFITVIPSIDTISLQMGFQMGKIPLYLKEGWWIKDEEFTFENDIAGAVLPFKNLLYNGDFEINDDGDNKPDGWTIKNTLYGNWTWDSSTAQNGSHSMNLESLDIPEGNTGIFHTILHTTINNVQPNSIYYMTAWIKSMNYKGRTLSVIFNSSHARQSFIGDKDTNGQWVKKGVCIKTNSDTSPLHFNSTVYVPEKFTGTIWIDNINIYRLDSSLKNVIRTNTTDIEITNLDKTITYKNGIDYSIVDGETDDIFDESLRSFQINRIQIGNITPDEIVLVSYDGVFFYRSDKYSVRNQPKCVSEPKLYMERYKPAINDVTKYLKPNIINLHSDEIHGFNRDSRNVKRNMSNAELISDWLNKIDNYVKSCDSDCRVMIMDDMLSPYHNGGDENYQINSGGAKGRMAEATEKDMVNKNVIICVWWGSNERLTQMEAATNFFKEKGYDYFVMPSSSNYDNIQSWSEIAFKKSGNLGVICFFLGDFYGFHITSDHFWNTRKKLVYFDSFEVDIDGDGTPNNWFVKGNPEYNTKDEKSQGRSFANFSKCAVKVTGDTDIFYSDFIPVKPNKKYFLSAYIMREKATSIEKPVLNISWYDANQKLIKGKIWPIDDVSHTYKCFEINWSHVDSYFIRIYLEGNGTESFWYDTICLNEEKTPIIPRRARLFGFIKNFKDYNDFSSFDARRLWYKSGKIMRLLTSGEKIMVAKPYDGLIKRGRFIIGRFNTAIISDAT
jgi:hypothetical protein